MWDLRLLVQLFDGVFSDCYGPYSYENENKKSFGPGDSSGESKGSGGGRGGAASRVAETAWEWNSPESLGGTIFFGEVDRYSGGGFYVDLPRDQDQVRHRDV